MFATNMRPNAIDLGNITTSNAFYASKFQDYVEGG